MLGEHMRFGRGASRKIWLIANLLARKYMTPEYGGTVVSFLTLLKLTMLYQVCDAGGNGEEFRRLWWDNGARKGSR